MDFSPPDSVTTIVPLHLMALNAPPHRWDVRTLTPPDSIVVRLVSCQGD